MSDYSISKYTGIVNANGGFTKNNRFQVNISLPGFVTTIVSGEDLNLFCSGASLPSHRVMTEEYNVLSNPLKIPYSFTTQELSFMFQLTEKYVIREAFEEWLEKIMNTKTYELSYKKDIVVDSWEIWQTDGKNEKTKGTKIYNVMPIQVSEIVFANDSSGIGIFTVMVSYDRREIIENTQ